MPLNPIQQLQSSLIAQLPLRIPVATETKLDAPEDWASGDFWWLDVWGAGRHVVIEWRSRKPHRQDVFGVSLVKPDGNVGEVSDEWLSFEGTVERVVELLCEGDLGG
jgi:hypothetical protein